ncbi:MAG: hypothetical protein KDB71_10755 [Mycobacterium sp.]|nr:hypothetical protein [Mycobacterium sp.]
MVPVLRVNPPVLRDVAGLETAVAAAVSGTGAGAALADAAAGMSGLHSAGGCNAARAALKAACQSVNTALGCHSEKLYAAARQYEAVDASSGRRLQQFFR